MEVVIRKFNGDSLLLSVPLTSTSTGKEDKPNKVVDLKRLIEEQWEYAPMVQKVISGAEVLEDDVLLVDLVPSEPPLNLTFVYSPPYNGDIQAAMRAQDKPAIRLLFKFRDQDRDQKITAQMALLMNKRLGDLTSWDRQADALMELGYSQDEVDAASGASYNARSTHLLRSIGPRPLERLQFVRVTSLPEQQCLDVELAEPSVIVELRVSFSAPGEAPDFAPDLHVCLRSGLSEKSEAVSVDYPADCQTPVQKLQAKKSVAKIEAAHSPKPGLRVVLIHHNSPFRRLRVLCSSSTAVTGYEVRDAEVWVKSEQPSAFHKWWTEKDGTKLLAAVVQD